MIGLLNLCYHEKNLSVGETTALKPVNALIESYFALDFGGFGMQEYCD